MKSIRAKNTTSRIFTKTRRRNSGLIVLKNKEAPALNQVTTIDETGSARGPTENRYYLIIGAKIRDRHAFNEAVYHYTEHLDHELSFNKDRGLRVAILKDIAPFVEEVFYVAAYRPPGYEYALTQKQVHTALLKQIREEAGADSDVDLPIIVDSNKTLIDGSAVRGIFNAKEANTCVTCVVLPSRYFYELQGHDFLTGAIGAELNQGNDTYTRILEDQGVRIKGRRIAIPLDEVKHEK